jgi:Carboxypeptidase regulatory-like domain
MVMKDAMLRLGRILLVLLLGLAVARASSAQIQNGTISGRVLDPSGAVVPGATVTALNTGTQSATQATTDGQGQFVFPELVPGTYSVSVEAQNFQKFVQQSVILHVSEKLALPDISLTVGRPTETVTVTSEQVTLQTDNAERTGTVDNKNMENIAVNGRSPITLTSLLPGISGVVEEEIAGTGGLSGFTANGMRNNSNNVTLNGITDVDTGLNGVQNVTVSLDSVQEFTALTGVYQAQYGRSSGAQLNMITKSGTANFHGSVYLYHRNEGLNANSPYHKLQAEQPPAGIPPGIDPFARSLFRLNDPGYTIGGPIYIPGKFNTNKDKLFFFVSQEFQRQLNPTTLTGVWIPTAAEATGDFSGDASPFIKDPLSPLPCTPAATSASPGGCFDGIKNGVPTLGVIPANRLWAPGLRWMQILSALDPTAAPVSATAPANYFAPESAIAVESPRTEDLVRIDYNATSAFRLYGSFIHNTNTTTGPFGGLAPSETVPLTTFVTPTPGYQWQIGGTYVLSPSLVDDFNFGVSNNSLHNATPSLLTQTGSGLTGADAFPLEFPNAVVDDYIPSIAYGNNAFNTAGGAVTAGDAPFLNFNTDIDATDNVSKVWRQHTFKTGIFIQHSAKNQTSFANANGNYSFASSASNPFDTGNGLANLATGIFSSFDQASAFLTGQYRYLNIEGYFQDTWKITPHLTLDYGLRLSWYQPQYDSSLQASSFYPNVYDPATAPVLYTPPGVGCPASFPGCNTGNSALWGDIIPGSGNTSDGFLQGNSKVGKYLMNNRFPQIGPRVGIAWDVTGRQNIVIRTGGGIYYDRVQGNRTFQMLQNPPEAFDPVVTFGCVNTAANCPAGAAAIGGPAPPPTVYGVDPTGKIPTVYQYSFGVQWKLPSQMVLDTSYVGTQGRHLTDILNLNGIPYGTTYQASSQNPSLIASPPPGVSCTNPATAGFDGMTGGLSGLCSLSANFLRPFPGYADIWEYQNAAISNYNSLQVSLTRQVGRNLSLMAAYTYAKNLTTTPQIGVFPAAILGSDFTPVRIDGETKRFNYTYAPFDQRHNFVVNYVYNFPSIFHEGWAHTVADGWQLSGVTRFATGNPYHVAFFDALGPPLGSGDSDFEICVTSCTGIFSPFVGGNSELTGSYTETAHVKITGPIASHGTPLQYLNPASFTTPTAPSNGTESSLVTAFGPGWNNWDMSLQKNWAVHERVTIQTRVDAFNAFNHTQWSGVNSLGVFVFGGIVNTAAAGTPKASAFGYPSGSRDPRILQLVARIVF